MGFILAAKVKETRQRLLDQSSKFIAQNPIHESSSVLDTYHIANAPVA